MKYSAMLTLALCTLSATAIASPMLNQQGRLTNGAGAVDGSYTLTFSFYDKAVNGKKLWSEVHAAVAVKSGVYSVVLGSVNAMPDDIFIANQSIYLELVVEKEKPLARQPIHAVPRAYTAQHLSCSGCVKTDMLANFLITSNKLAEGSVNAKALADGAVGKAKLGASGCTNGQVFKFDGKTKSWQCSADQSNTYTGKNFATSNQSCPTGQVMRGISSTGKLLCTKGTDLSKCKVCWEARKFSTKFGWNVRSKGCVPFNKYSEFAEIGDSDNSGWHKGQYKIMVTCP